MPDVREPRDARADRDDVVNQVVIMMKNGEKVRVVGFESQITEQINAARQSGQLLRLERPKIPTGQMVGIDPAEVAIVKGD
jgi:hypothetical protein